MSWFLKVASISLFSLFLGSCLYAQSYFANGDAKSIGNQCYELTPSVNWKLGSVWYADKLNLNKDFDLEFYLNFGTQDAGADGIVFVMQTVGNKAIGQSGGGLGFEGFSPSLGIEFDDYLNSDKNDPAYDHIGILKNGSVNHGSGNSISSPVAATPTAINIEDGKDHLVRIKWSASINLLQVYFDCSLRHSITLDIKNSIFYGVNEVYWGFTSATGGRNNRHLACLRDDILIPDTIPLCKGDTKLLNARASKNNKYVWRPSTGLNDTTIQKPTTSITVPIQYLVEYVDLCDNVLTDTIQIKIDQPFEMDEGHDSLLCDKKAYKFDFTVKYDSVLWENGSPLKYRYITDSGYYKVRAWKGVCYDDDSFNITTNVSPSIDIEGDLYFCDGDSALQTIVLSPFDALHTWNDGGTEISRYISETSNIFIRASNICGNALQTKRVTEIQFDEFDLGDSIALCDNDTINLSVPLFGPFTYLWSTGDSVQSTKVASPGLVWFTVSQEECFASDSVNVYSLDKPYLDLEDYLLLCNNEKVVLTVPQQNAKVIWQNNFESFTYQLINYEGVVEVKASNKCGVDSQTVNVELKDCYCDLIFPNAITSNSDNLNDVFKPVVNCTKLESYNLKIYNRWGEKLFSSADISNGWDANYNGLKVPQGVYFFIAEYKGIENGFSQSKIEKGIITVCY